LSLPGWVGWDRPCDAQTADRQDRARPQEIPPLHITNGILGCGSMSRELGTLKWKGEYHPRIHRRRRLPPLTGWGSIRGTMSNERRQLADQRSRPTRPLSRYSLRGRRKRSRRQGEGRDYYVDRYEPRYFALISLILLLCVLDAYFTLKIIDLGGKELNRFMLSFLINQPAAALIFKYVVTAVSISIFLVHKNFLVFGRLRVYSLIYVFFFVYLLLVAYEAAAFFTHVKTAKFMF
jgi:hypothetical protein